MGISEIIKFMCDSIHTPIAICDIEYNIIYENKAAVERFNHGREFVGKNIESCFSVETLSKIYAAFEWFKEEEKNNTIFVYHNDKDNTDVYINAVRDDRMNLIAVYSYEICRNLEAVKPFDID